MKIKIRELDNLIKRILSSTYYSKKQAKEISEVLLYAEMTGKNTQGIVKLLGREPIQNIKPKYEPKILKETRLSVLLDGGGNPGILASRIATKLVIKKCKENGFGIVGTNNTFSSTGVIGFYAREITKEDFVGLVMSGSPGGVAPYGSLEPLLGTNPLAFAFPTDNEPFVFDMATAAITWYGLVRAKILGQKLPEGVAMDKQGEPTTDPSKAMDGAIYPFDKGYKGSSLSMVIEIFTGPLVGAAYCSLEGDWGNLFMAIDPELLVDQERFKKNCTELIKRVKKSKVDKKIGQIFVPGEKSLMNLRKAEEAGEVEIEDKLLAELREKAQNLTIAKY